MNGGYAVPTQSLPPDYVTWSELTRLCKIVGPLTAMIIALLIVTYKAMQKTDEKTIKAFEAHVAADDSEHDRLFTDLRATDSKLDQLIGEHKGRTCPTDHHPNPDSTWLP